MYSVYKEFPRLFFIVMFLEMRTYEQRDYLSRDEIIRATRSFMYGDKDLGVISIRETERCESQLLEEQEFALKKKQEMVLKEDFPNIDIFFEFRNFLADVASIENRKAWEFFHVGFLTHGSEKHILWKIMLVKKVVIRQLKHLLNITNKGKFLLVKVTI